ncbi:MAG: hypothetical protein ACLPWS_19545 [Rhodomicrobium sp.]
MAGDRTSGVGFRCLFEAFAGHGDGGAGDRRFTKLFEPAARRALQGLFWSGDRLVLSILDNLKPVFEVLTPDEVLGHARLSRACLRMALPMSGHLTSRSTNPMAMFLPWLRIR